MIHYNFILIHRALTCNMHSLGTSQELCLDFLKKNVVALNLPKGKRNYRYQID